MKSFTKLFGTAIVLIVLLFVIANTALLSSRNRNSKPYRVEIDRLADKIKNSGYDSISLTECQYVTDILPCNGKEPASFFQETDNDYAIRIINGMTYRFEYTAGSTQNNRHTLIVLNAVLAIMSLFVLCVLLFIRHTILAPFERLRDIPYELSKGNLTAPIKENKYRFFGKFIWGINLLRENIEHHRQLELNLLREKKTLVLSLSHDIKTPLSAIKLYAKALSRGLYPDAEKQLEIAENINNNADKIEGFVSRIIQASSEDLLKLDVKNDEFYLSSLMENVLEYYREKLDLLKIELSAETYSDCLLKGDFDRSIEVMQNIIENAIKYGQGSKIEIKFSTEEDCQLITVKNSSCTLKETELPHIFESFIRGSNAEGIPGSGLGLYICRNLMQKMGGEIFAEVQNTGGHSKNMLVTAVFVMAGKKQDI